MGSVCVPVCPDVHLKVQTDAKCGPLKREGKGANFSIPYIKSYIREWKQNNEHLDALPGLVSWFN